MYRTSLIIITLSLLFSSTTHTMDRFKHLLAGAGALLSLGLIAYAYTQSTPKSIIKIIPEHTPGKEGKPKYYRLFTLYKTTDKTRVGSINATYDPLTHTATLKFIQVFKEYQKHGYGKQLWNTMIDELKQLDIHTVTWKAVPINLPASLINTPECEKELNTLIAWYEKRGGHVTARYSTEAQMMLTLK